MTRDEAAKRLDGCQYGQEGSSELWAEMKEAGLVAVFGYSDDNMEFRGAVYDEVSCFDGGFAAFTREGLLKNACSESDCPYFAKLEEAATPVEAVWADSGVSWRYETKIPHSTFVVMEDGEPYCQGIVFALADVPMPKQPLPDDVRAALEGARSGLMAFTGGSDGACSETIARIDALLAG